MVPPPGYPVEFAFEVVEGSTSICSVPSARAASPCRAPAKTSWPGGRSEPSAPFFGGCRRTRATTPSAAPACCRPAPPPDVRSSRRGKRLCRCPRHAADRSPARFTWTAGSNPAFVSGSYDRPLAGNPVGIEDCGSLAFEPTITSRPTTSTTDSPSGLDFDLHQPQAPALQEVPGRHDVCSQGEWEGVPAPQSYGYAWLRNGTPIPGAEAKEYELATADAGGSLQCIVGASGSVGKAFSASPLSQVLQRANPRHRRRVRPRSPGQTHERCNRTEARRPSPANRGPGRVLRLSPSNGS